MPVHIDNWINDTQSVSISNIDAKATGQTDLLVVPASQYVVIEKVHVLVTTLTTPAAAPIYKVGSNAANYDNYLGATTLSANTTANTGEQRITTASVVPIYNNTTIKFNITTASTAATETLKVILVYRVVAL